MVHKLYVCQTCQRDATLAPGTPSRGVRLSGALEHILRDARIANAMLVRVACLNGCPNPCNVALRATRKFSLRLSRLDAAHAPAVVELLSAYVEHASGDVPVADWPARLATHSSARVPPPHLLSGAPKPSICKSA